VVELPENGTLEMATAGADPAIFILTPKAPLNTANIDRVFGVIDELAVNGIRYFLCDLCSVGHMDTGAWNLMAFHTKQCAARSCHVFLTGMNGDVMRSYTYLNMSQVLQSYGSINEGVERIYARLGKSLSSIPKEPPAENAAPANPAGAGNAEPLSSLPVEEKIKRIIAEHGPQSLSAMRQFLENEKYGGVRMGMLKMYFILKKQNLETWDKQARYYRSC
jgi:ABC-type transporter Mla MlaB component